MCDNMLLAHSLATLMRECWSPNVINCDVKCLDDTPEGANLDDVFQVTIQTSEHARYQVSFANDLIIMVTHDGVWIRVTHWNSLSELFNWFQQEIYYGKV